MVGLGEIPGVDAFEFELQKLIEKPEIDPKRKKIVCKFSLSESNSNVRYFYTFSLDSNLNQLH